MEVRTDTYLWAIRMFKTRTLASDAIKGGKVKLNSENTKPSKLVKIGDTFQISSLSDEKKIIAVTALLDKRQSFEIAQKHYEDISPVSDKKDKIERAFFTSNIKRERGTGRPTKKEWRDLKDFGLDY